MHGTGRAATALAILLASNVGAQEPSPVDQVIGPQEYSFSLRVDLERLPKGADAVDSKILHGRAGLKAVLEEGSIDTTNLTSMVRVTVEPTADAGMFIVQVFEKGVGALGHSRVRLLRPRLPSPGVRAWAAGESQPSSYGQLKLPPPGQGKMAYIIELESDDNPAHWFLTSDTLRFITTSQIEVRPVTPTGPSPNAPSKTAQYQVYIDPADPPPPGPVTMEIVNAARERSQTAQIRLVSLARPIVARVEPQEVAGGANVTVTLWGKNFDLDVSLDPSSFPGPHNWTLTRENHQLVRVAGTAPQAGRPIILRLRNGNDEQTGETRINVVAGRRGELTLVEAEAGQRQYFVDEPVSLSLRLHPITGTTLPVPGEDSAYRVEIGGRVADFRITQPGILEVNFSHPDPGAPSSTTSLARDVRVFHTSDARPRWEKYDAITFQLRPNHTGTRTVGGTSLYPGAEQAVEIIGRHFRPGTATVRISNGMATIKGAPIVRHNHITLTVVTDRRATGAVMFQVGHDDFYDMGSISVAKLPDLSFLGLTSGDSTVQAGSRRPLRATSTAPIYLTLNPQKGSALQGPEVLVVTASRDTVGFAKIKEQEVLYDPSGSVPELFFIPASHGLKPGQRARVEVHIKDQPHVRTEIPVKIRRSGWQQRLGVLLSPVGYRHEFNGTGDAELGNALMSDLHIGAEYLPFDTEELSVGLGWTVLGANGTPRTAFSVTGRLNILTVIAGVQLGSEEKDIFQRPRYLMLSAGFGKNVQDILKALGN